MNPDPDDVTFQFNQVQLSPVDEGADADDDVRFGCDRIGDNGKSKLLELTPEKSPENDDVDEDGGIGSVLQQFKPETDDVTFKIRDVQIDLKSQRLTPDTDDVDNKEADVEVVGDDVDDADDDVTFNISEVQIVSKSQQFTPENDDVDDEEADVEGEDTDDDVTFNISQVQIVSNSQQITPENSPENDDVENEEDEVTFGSSQVDINTHEEADVEDENADVEGEEFTFMCINPDNDNNSTTSLTEKTVFPLFDQTLLLHNNFNNQDGKRINDIHVSNVFIESPRDATSSSSSSTSSSTLTAITADSNEMNMKSNSTGFSKLWRFRDDNNMNRSNSDGRDAFVFLNPKTEGKSARKTEGNVKGKGVKEEVKKKVSAHEVYMKKAKKGGGGKEEEKRRKSYLPYRPGLMGFFTNVNGGLSKNVHPF